MKKVMAYKNTKKNKTVNKTVPKKKKSTSERSCPALKNMSNMLNMEFINKLVSKKNTKTKQTLIKKKNEPKSNASDTKDKRKLKNINIHTDETQIFINNCSTPIQSENVTVGENDKTVIALPKINSEFVGETTCPPSPIKKFFTSRKRKSNDKETPEDVPKMRKSIRERKTNQSSSYHYYQ